ARHLVRRKNRRLISFHSRSSLRGSRQRKPKPGPLGYGQHSASRLRGRRNLFRRQIDPEKWRVSSEAIALAKLALIFDQSDLVEPGVSYAYFGPPSRFSCIITLSPPSFSSRLAISHIGARSTGPGPVPGNWTTTCFEFEFSITDPISSVGENPSV